MKDIVTGEILSHQISNNLELGFVQESLKDLEKYDLEGVLIHSDQGFHYTQPFFISSTLYWDWFIFQTSFFIKIFIFNIIK